MTYNKLIAAIILTAVIAPVAAADIQDECQVFNQEFDNYKTSTPSTGQAYEQTSVEIIASFTKPINAANTKATLLDPAEQSISTEQTPTTGDASEFTYTPTRSRLTDGTYYLSVTGNDGKVNRSSCVKFQVDTPQMDIWVDEPNPTGLDRPNFAYSETSQIDLTLRTERPGVCRMQLNTSRDLTNLSEAYEAFGSANQLNTENNGLDHSKTVNLVADQEPYDVICRETNNPGQSQADRYAYERITLGQDTTPPELSLSLTPPKLIELGDTTITVNATDDDDTKEPVLCEVSDTENLLDDYTPKPWVNTTQSSYRSTHQINARATVPGQTTVEATCENRAGLQATTTTSFEASNNRSENIRFEEPSDDFTNQQNLPVTVSTQSSNTVCTVSTGTTQVSLDGQGFIGDRYHHQGTVQLPAQEQTHSLEATCSFKGVRDYTTNTTITLDTTPPRTPIMEVDDASCTPEQVSFTIQQAGDTTPTLSYEVANNTNDSQVYSQGSRQTNTWNVKANTPDLPVNHTVRITTTATDRAGNNQTKSAQTQIQSPEQTVCDKTPPGITVDEANKTGGSAVYDVTCTDGESGCKDTYQYSMSPNPGQCTYDQQNNQNTSIRVQQNGYLCVAVYDQNNNNATATEPIRFNVPPHCSDGERNVDETGVDCGGPQSSCALCGTGKQCDSNADCYPELTCNDGVCQQPQDHCSNDVQDQGETGVDCGGPDCAPCTAESNPGNNSNTTCTANADCASNNCVDGVCQAPTCDDNIKNQFETGVDCGGPNCEECQAEPGKPCTDDTDCPGPEFACETVQGTNQCVQTPATCSNGEQDGAETGVDCGGPDCQSCQTGTSCQANTDCVSGLCQNNTCTAPSCSDSVQNQGESDVDCGQVCAPSQLCDIGDTCDTDADCTSGNCNDDTGICQAPSCTNQKQDGDETDVDCGGPTCVQEGYTCSNGEQCERDADCATEYCADDGTCKLPPNQDSDNDGLPDRWENKHGACKTCMEPLEDPDEDGFTNLEEYKASTDPNDSADFPDRPENNTPAYILLITGFFFTAAGAGLIYYDEQLREPQRNTDFSLDDSTPSPTPDEPTQAPPKPDQPTTPPPVDGGEESDTMQQLEDERDELLDAFDDDTADDSINFTTSADTAEAPETPQAPNKPETPETPDESDDYITTESLDDDDTTDSDKDDDVFDELDDLT